MANLKTKVDEMFAELNTAIAMTGKVSEIIDVFKNLSMSLHLSANIKPLDLIIQLLEKLGVKREDLIEWIAKYMNVLIVPMEIAVKGALLANLKGLISCSIDPFIPDKLRSDGGGGQGSNLNDVGLTFTLDNIDYFNKLRTNPLSKEGKYKYFGTEGISNVYEFIRAYDMDAFLYLVVNKGIRANIQEIQKMDDFNKYGVKALSGNSLLEPVQLVLNGKAATSTILPGCVFNHGKNSSVISMCHTAHVETDSQTGLQYIDYNWLLPVSSTSTGLSWYKNNGMWWDNLCEWSIRKIENSYKPTNTAYLNRDFDKDTPICTFSYENATSNNSGDTRIRFTILPKPAIHYPNYMEGESLLNYHKLRFNAKGEPDSSGAYSYNPNLLNDARNNTNTGNIEYQYIKPEHLKKPKKGKSSAKGIYTFSNGVVLTVAPSGYTVNDCNKNIELLQECYPKLTLFEFNYDYVMSLKLFDAKVLTATILEALMNIDLGVTTDIKLQSQQEEEKIKEILKNVVDQLDGEVEDCFYNFSNEKYAALLRKAEERRLRQTRVGYSVGEVNTANIDNALEEYSAAATPAGRVTQLKRAITEATISISGATGEENSQTAQFKFLYDFIQELIIAIIKAILSPKVMMLLAVNTSLMGNDVFRNFKQTFEDFFKTLESLIVGIIRNIKDLVLQELLKLVIQYLMPIVEKMTALLTDELLEEYLKIIRNLIQNCNMSYFFSLLSMFKSKYDDTTLDKVDYPDIETSDTSELKLKNNC